MSYFVSNCLTTARSYGRVMILCLVLAMTGCAKAPQDARTATDSSEKAFVVSPLTASGGPAGAADFPLDDGSAAAMPSISDGPILPDLPVQSEPAIAGNEPPPFPAEEPGKEEPGMETVTVTVNGKAAIEPKTIEFGEFDPSQGVAREIQPRPAISPTARQSSDSGFTRETIYFATNRKRTGSTSAKEAYSSHRGELQWGMCQVSIPYKHKPGEMESPKWYQWSEDPKQHIILMEPLEQLSEANWMTRIRQKLAGASSSEILVFVHGYNVTFENAVRRTAQLSYDLNFPGAAVCFSWPAGNSMVYTTDWTNAEWSLPHCLHVLKQLALFSRADKIHIVAHSMGSRVVTFSLKELLRELPVLDNQPLFNQVVLAAPDLDAEIFRTQIAPAIQKASRRLTIYASEQDLALKLSQGLNGGTRLGTATPVSLTTTGFEWIDCIDATAMSQEPMMTLQHAYYGDSPRMISDLRRVLAGENATMRGLICEKPGLFQIR